MDSTWQDVTYGDRSRHVAVRLRMTRLGRRHRPFYRLAAFDARSKRDGRVIEHLGFFDPLARDEEKQLKVNNDRAAYWLSVGAQPSETVRKLLKRSGVEVKAKKPHKKPAS